MFQNIEEKRILHDCSSGIGSIGGPLLSSKSHKVIGIHIDSIRSKNLNIASSISQDVSNFKIIIEIIKIS